MLIVNSRVKIPESELDFSFARSQGPGGQNVNKVNTKVTMRWRIAENASLPADVRDRFVKKYHRRINKEGEVLVMSQRYRDQPRNIEDCRNKLRQLIVDVWDAPIVRRSTAPTKGSRRRRRKEKEAHSQKKQQRKPPGWDG